MSDMGHQGAAVMDVAQDPSVIWSQHIQGAVGEFLKTAVVIDNQPWVREQSSESLAQIVSGVDTGLDADLPELDAPIAPSEERPHDLDVRAISDVFASKGVACAFVLPDDTDTQDDQKVSRAVAAAKVSDLIVIDWYLKRQDESLTLSVLREIARSDANENGRLRLICIYTGEPLKDSIFDEVKKFLQEGGVVVKNIEGEEYCAAGDHTLVVIKSKVATPAAQLPSELINLFSRFADGLIPAFSLAAVGAIRRNAHHMLTRFGKWLDTAYIANRLITNPPGDVSELLRELFIAECDSALGLESVADRYLDIEPIAKWLAANKDSIADQEPGKHVRIDDGLLSELLRNGVKDDNYFYGDQGDIKIPRDRRNLISAALAGSIEASKLSEHEFARLVVLKREAYGRSKLWGEEAWRPSLTTGTLIKYKIKESGVDERGNLVPDLFEYLICLTPACDTLRLADTTPFVFLRAQVESKKYGLVLREQGDVEVCLRLDSKKPVVRTFFFSPDLAVQRVLALENEQAGFKFLDSEEREFFWLGEVRYTRAASEMAGLVRNWMRIGVSDSEYLRLTNEGRF